MDRQTRRLQVLQQPYCTWEKAYSESCHQKSVRVSFIFFYASSCVQADSRPVVVLSFSEAFLKFLPRQTALRPFTQRLVGLEHTNLYCNLSSVPVGKDGFFFSIERSTVGDHWC